MENKSCEKTKELEINEKLKHEKEYFDNMFKKTDPNILLDDEQRKIILTDENYLMVIAGAGAGKTTTITAKVNYLIQKQNIKENEIIIITFTNKAVRELQERINTQFKHNVKITTFHKFGYEIIKQNSSNPSQIIENPQEIIKEYIIKNPMIKKELAKYLKISKNKTTKEQDTINKITTYCSTFINLFKAKGLKYKDFEKFKIINRKTKNIINILKQLYIYYEETLIKSNKIDFDDMIFKPIEILKQAKKINMKYKYIIIDEYQDISENRYNLIKIIQEKLNTKIMVVGDDWQCIFGFAASNINLFTKFVGKEKYFQILKITKTYRNSQQLIDIAGKFIQKNKNQITKNLKSPKQLSNPITIIKYKKNKSTKLQQIIDYIIKKYGPEKNILILGRYTFDKDTIIDNKIILENNNKIKYIKSSTTIIDYMTIHSSKGLGYDNVILINTEKAKLGFPTNKRTDKILKQLITTEKTIRYAEERRLFYVALTRTKNEIIIMTPKYKQSVFIKEIKKYKNVTIKSNIT